MSTNKHLQRFDSQRKNYRLYKAKKQWITACAVAFITFGASALVSTSVQADTTNLNPEVIVPTLSASASSGPASTSDSQTEKSTIPVVTSPATASATPAVSVQPVAGQALSDSSDSDTASKQAPSLTTFELTQSSANQSANSSAAASNINAVTMNLDQQLKESKVTAEENIAPEIYPNYAPGAWSGYIVQGTDMSKFDPAKFLTNAKEIEDAGGKITWDGTPPEPTAEDVGGDPLQATIKVTYKDNTSTTVDVEYQVDAGAQPNYGFNQTAIMNNHTAFYYLPDASSPIDLQTFDKNGTAIWLPNGVSNINTEYSIIPNLDAAGLPVTDVKLIKGVTKTVGFDDVIVQVTQNDPEGNNTAGMSVMGSHEVKIPVLIKTLPTLEKNPVINAQLEQNTASSSPGAPVNLTFWTTPRNGSYDSLSNNGAASGRFFYQDYLKYYVLGGQMEILPYYNELGTVGDPLKEFTVKLASADNEPTTVKINWVKPPKISTNEAYFFNNIDNSLITPINVQKWLGKSITTMKSTEVAKYVSPITLVNGQTTKPTGMTISSSAGAVRAVNAGKGEYKVKYDPEFGEPDKNNGNPLILSNQSVTPSEQLRQQIIALYESLIPNQEVETMFSWGTGGGNTYQPTTYLNVTGIVHIFNNPTNIDEVVDINNGPQTFDSDRLKTTYFSQALAGPRGVPTNWPEGTTFKLVPTDGGSAIVLDAPGQTKTGKLTITLPTGDSRTVDVTLRTEPKPGNLWFWKGSQTLTKIIDQLKAKSSGVSYKQLSVYFRNVITPSPVNDNQEVLYSLAPGVTSADFDTNQVGYIKPEDSKPLLQMTIKNKKTGEIVEQQDIKLGLLILDQPQFVGYEVPLNYGFNGSEDIKNILLNYKDEVGYPIGINWIHKPDTSKPGFLTLQEQLIYNTGDAGNWFGKIRLPGKQVETIDTISVSKDANFKPLVIHGTTYPVEAEISTLTNQVTKLIVNPGKQATVFTADQTGQLVNQAGTALVAGKENESLVVDSSMTQLSPQQLATLLNTSLLQRTGLPYQLSGEDLKVEGESLTGKVKVQVGDPDNYFDLLVPVKATVKVTKPTVPTSSASASQGTATSASASSASSQASAAGSSTVPASSTQPASPSSSASSASSSAAVVGPASSATTPAASSAPTSSSANTEASAVPTTSASQGMTTSASASSVSSQASAAGSSTVQEGSTQPASPASSASSASSSAQPAASASTVTSSAAVVGPASAAGSSTVPESSPQQPASHASSTVPANSSAQSAGDSSSTSVKVPVSSAAVSSSSTEKSDTNTDSKIPTSSAAVSSAASVAVSATPVTSTSHASSTSSASVSVSSAQPANSMVPIEQLETSTTHVGQDTSSNMASRIEGPSSSTKLPSRTVPSDLVDSSVVITNTTPNDIVQTISATTSDNRKEEMRSSHMNEGANHKLPQTGNYSSKVMLSLGVTTLLTMFGLAGINRSRRRNW